MRSRVHIDGYAAISEDGMLANAEGVMPGSLKVEADQRFFERELDRADVVVQGRHSGEDHPNSPLRRRLILTRQVRAIAPHPSNPNAFLWNPSGAPFAQALEAFRAPCSNIGVIGAAGVFEIFLDRYDAFCLSRVSGVLLPGGRPVFQAVPKHTPEHVLTIHGLERGPKRIIRARPDDHPLATAWFAR